MIVYVLICVYIIIVPYYSQYCWSAPGGELGTSYFLPRIVGRGRAAAHLLTGKEISTEQAEQWGLLNEAGKNSK